MKFPFNYLVEIQYLGFRYHGWAKQPNVKTVHHMIDRTLNYILGDDHFRTLGTSRTDSMVSAFHSGFQLFLHKEIPDIQNFLNDFNDNLPPDIRALKMQPVPPEFNIIQSPRIKEYEYSFCFGEKPHPFCAPFMAYFPGSLDLDAMKSGAQLYAGTHDFKKYTIKPNEEKTFIRTIITSSIEHNEMYQGNFFPDVSYSFIVASAGFLRQQVRLMMGQLIKLGRKEITLEELSESLKGLDVTPVDYIVPASGLLLKKISFTYPEE